jgi:hypothetical protein
MRVDSGQRPIFELSDIEKRVWQAPKLEKLRPSDIEGGFANVAEVDGGVLDIS